MKFECIIIHIKAILHDLYDCHCMGLFTRSTIHDCDSLINVTKRPLRLLDSSTLNHIHQDDNRITTNRISCRQPNT